MKKLAKPAAKGKKATPKNKTSKTARRTAIAKGLIEQKTPSAIAGELGITRKTVYEELKAPETQDLIRRWMQIYHDDITSMIPLALQAIRDGLAPAYVVGDADEQRLVPVELIDRLRAVKMLGYVMNLAQGKSDDNSQASLARAFDGTMEELLIVYKTVSATPAE